jgi:RNA polymerase sigma-70 factor, ECF subfamily
LTTDIALELERSLVARCAAGDEQALGQLYDRLGRQAYALARRVTQDDGLAADVVQEAFLDAWKSSARYDESRGKVATWLLTIVHRRAVDTVRRASVRPGVASKPVEGLPEIAGDVDVPGDVIGRDEAARVRAALAQLPATQRNVLELAYLDGLTQSEIADRLHEPLGTVKSRTHTGLQRLRELLEEHQG